MTLDFFFSILLYFFYDFLYFYVLFMPVFYSGTSAYLARRYIDGLELFFNFQDILLILFAMKSLGGLRVLVNDQGKLIMAVGGVTALAAGVYTTRFNVETLHLYALLSSFFSNPLFF